jgi:hypothetical protein
MSLSSSMRPETCCDHRCRSCVGSSSISMGAIGGLEIGLPRSKSTSRARSRSLVISHSLSATIAKRDPACHRILKSSGDDPLKHAQGWSQIMLCAYDPRSGSHPPTVKLQQVPCTHHPPYAAPQPRSHTPVRRRRHSAHQGLETPHLTAHSTGLFTGRSKIAAL